MVFFRRSGQAYDYNACTSQAKKEIQAEYKPPLKGQVEDMGNFTLILLGSPNWWSSIAPPAAAFLAGYDLTGKVIVPFCSPGGGGQGHLVRDIAKLCPGSRVLNCLALRDGSSASNRNRIFRI
jgi:hypothetical protein